MLRSDLVDFANWCSTKLVTPANVNTLALEEYRKTWNGAPGTRSRRQVRLSHFLKYWVKHQWMQQNFATEMPKIKVPNSPTLPFTREEFERMIEAAQHFKSGPHEASWPAASARHAAIVALERFMYQRCRQTGTVETYR
jgi:site-specific recombinase XerD